MINEDGSGLEAITTESNFNAFPMFSFDGKKLIFSSKRIIDYNTGFKLIVLTQH